MSTQMFTINTFKYTYMYTLIFEVSDSGIGINEEQLSRIFYRFKQMLIDKISKESFVFENVNYANISVKIDKNADIES